MPQLKVLPSLDFAPAPLLCLSPSIHEDLDVFTNSLFDNFDATRTPEFLETPLLNTQRRPLAQHSLYFWVFVPSLPTSQLCFHPQVPWCCSGTTGRAGILGCSFVTSCQRGQLANPTLRLQMLFLRPLANSDSRRVLKAAFESKMLAQGDGPTANSFTVQPEDLSETFSK